MRRKCIGVLLALIVAVTFSFGTVTGVSAKTAVKTVGAKTTKTRVKEADQKAPDFSEMIARKGVRYADSQLIAVYDDKVSNRTIRSDASEVGTALDITRTDEQKMALIDCADDPETAAQQLEQNDRIAYVQPNFRYEICEDAAAPDPFLDPANQANYQYAMANTNAEQAWDMIEADPNHPTTIVGVVDTGVDSRHEDLKNNLITVDEHGKYYGFIEGEQEELYDDAAGHGTHVSGIIGAEYGNGLGGSGVASGHNNDLVKVITSGADSNGGLFSYDICKAIDYNVASGARVINMSFGGAGYDIMMEECIARHYYEDGTVFVAASGNDGTNSYSTPCDYPTVISVNATSSRKEATYFSDYGKNKDIAAPGHNIMSTMPGSMYGMMSGTSMASPVVAGICGLVLDMNPDLSPAQVKNIVCATTTEAQQGKGFAPDLAYGNIDAEAAVRAAAEASADVKAASLTIKEDEADERTIIRVGESTGLTARIMPATSLHQVTWTSSDPSVAAVDETGKVTGISAGKADITASCDGLTASVEVKINGVNAPERVQIKDKEDLQEIAYMGSMTDYGTFEVETLPEGSTVPEYVFECSDQSVLFVDGPGYYLAKKPGIVTVTLKDIDGNVLDQMEVTVKDAVSAIKFTKRSSLISAGKSFTFAAQATDPDAYHPEIEWSVSNSKGRIDPVSGKFTAKKPGYCYVIAQTENGVYSACKVVICKGSYDGADYGLKVKRAGSKAKLTWNKLPGKVKYQIAKKSGAGAWKTVKVVSGSTYADGKARSGDSYRVRAVLSGEVHIAKIGWSKAVKVK